MKDELLIKFLLKEASPEEDQYVLKWLEQDQANRKKFQQFKLIWDSSKELALQNPLDEELAWNRFKRLRDQKEGYLLPAEEGGKVVTFEVPNATKHTSFGWLKVAATAIISIGLLVGVYLYLIAPRHPYFHTIEVVSNDQPIRETLPDGTFITLNKHSKVTYKESLFHNRRLIKMSREVFFDLSQDASIPFEVTTNDVAIKVLGTSFNVKNNQKMTEVIVETGAVQVSRKDVVIKLKPDEKAIALAGEKGIEQKQQTDRLYDYYRSKVFKLDHTPLWRFVEVLNEVYQTNIVIENAAIGSLPITTTFDNDSLTTILNTLCETLQLRTEKDRRIITIKR